MLLLLLLYHDDYFQDDTRYTIFLCVVYSNMFCFCCHPLFLCFAL